MNDRSDAELVRSAQSGDHLAWELLVGRHAVRLAAYLGARIRRPDLVDKLVAESIYAAWRHLAELDDPAGFPAWFRRIGANQALKWHKSHPKESLVAALPAERCEGDAGIQELDRALGRLSEGQRMALEQRFRGGLTGAELAEALHVADARAADGQVVEALRMLQTVLEAG